MTSPQTAQTAPVSLPRVAITYCTQCKWMLRATYFGQELLSTFGTQIGEIALIPATGGLFSVELTYLPQPEKLQSDGGEVSAKKVLLWDRKAEGGFPETKVLKQRVRDHIDPARDLGHSDVHGKKKKEEEEEGTETEGKEKKEKDGGGGGEQVLSVRQAVGGVLDEGVEVRRNPDGSICEDCR